MQRIGLALWLCLFGSGAQAATVTYDIIGSYTAFEANGFCDPCFGDNYGLGSGEATFPLTGQLVINNGQFSSVTLNIPLLFFTGMEIFTEPKDQIAGHFSFTLAQDQNTGVIPLTLIEPFGPDAPCGYFPNECNGQPTSLIGSLTREPSLLPLPSSATFLAFGCVLFVLLMYRSHTKAGT